MKEHMYTKPNIGSTFGKLTIIQQLPNKYKVYKNGNRSSMCMVKCQCECGNVIELPYSQLTRGMTKTCGSCVEREIIGKRFNKLTVVKYAGIINNNRLFECKCDCGTTTVVSLSRLRSGHTKSCGRCVERMYLSKTFGDLYVVEYLGKDKFSRSLLKCICKCGNEVVVTTDYIHRSNQPSCGQCYQGLEDSYKKEYYDRCLRLSTVYEHIKSRTSNPNNKSFYQYGGRGIKLMFTKIEFVKMYYKDINYQFGKQIDRIDNDANYSFDNVRWVTPLENSKNRSISKSTNITYDSISKRLTTLGTLKIYRRKIDVSTPQKFTVIDFPLKTAKGEDLKLFLHETVVNGLISKTMRIVNFYKEFGYDLDLNKLTVRDIVV